MGKAAKKAVFKLDNSGGVLTDISAKLNDIKFPRPVDTEEDTTFGGDDKTYTVTLRSATISLEGRWDATIDAHLDAVRGQEATLSFEYGPQNGNSGSVKYTGECLLTKYDIGSPVGGIIPISVELQVTGAVTRGTYA